MLADFVLEVWMLEVYHLVYKLSIALKSHKDASVAHGDWVDAPFEQLEIRVSWKQGLLEFITFLLC